MNSGEPMYSLRECGIKPMKWQDTTRYYTLAVGLFHSISEIP